MSNLVSKTALSLGGAAIVGALWYRGRHARASWNPAPDIEIRGIPGRETDRITVLFVGSFVHPAEAAHGLIDHLLAYGDVMLVKYSVLRYQLGIPAEMAYDHLPYRYTTAYVLGGSLGGREAQRLALMFLEYKRISPKNLLTAGTGVPDGPDCLSPAARVSAHIRPGPIMNKLLSRPVVRQWFMIVPEETWSPGTNRDAMEANLKAMHLYQLSAIGDQVTACGQRDDRTDFSPLQSVRSFYIMTGPDIVVRQGTCTLRWLAKQPKTHLVYEARVGHFTWPEHPDWWWAAILEGFNHFNIKPLETEASVG